MDLDQLIKRVDWLDENRRKDKTSISTLEERLVVLEGELSAARQMIKEQNGEIIRLSAVLARVDQFDTSLAQHRVEFARALEELDKRRTDRDREIEEVRRVQIDGFNNHLLDLRKSLELLPDLQAGLKNRLEEDYRLARLIEELKQHVEDYHREEEEAVRSLRLMEEGRRQDSKRLTDLQGEVFALRKRVDDHRGRIDLASDSLRKTEARIGEILSVDADRRENLNNFFERQALAEVDRDRKWKEYQARFESIEGQAMELETHIQSLQTTYRDIRRLQEAVETAIGRVDRRANEITEMQRLAEDRFRQEWVTFKADDQKRWTNYALTQEEQTREAARLQARLGEKITELEDHLQELQDITHQAEEQTEKRLQSLLAMTRDWVADYERVFGGTR